MCTWCGHVIHAGVCPDRIVVQPATKHRPEKTEPCPCRSWVA